MEQVVRFEVEHVFSIGSQIPKIQIAQPIIIDIDIGTLEFVILSELMMKGFPEHASAAGNVDFFHNR